MEASSFDQNLADDQKPESEEISESADYSRRLNDKERDRKNQLFDLIYSLRLARVLMIAGESKIKRPGNMAKYMVASLSEIFNLMHIIILLKSVFAHRMDLHSLDYPIVIFERPQPSIATRILQKLCANLTWIDPVFGQFIITAIKLYIGDDQKKNDLVKLLNVQAEETVIQNIFTETTNNVKERIISMMRDEANTFYLDNLWVEKLAEVIQKTIINKDKIPYTENNFELIQLTLNLLSKLFVDGGLQEIRALLNQEQVDTLIVPYLQSLFQDFNEVTTDEEFANALALKFSLQQDDSRSIAESDYFKIFWEIVHLQSSIVEIDRIYKYIIELIHCAFTANNEDIDWRKNYATFVWEQDESIQFDPYRYGPADNQPPQENKPFKKENPFPSTLQALKPFKSR